MRPTKLLLCVVILAGLIATMPSVFANTVRDIRFEVNPDNVKILLSADENVQYTTFKPAENWMVVDLIGCSIQDMEPVYQVKSPLVAQIKASAHRSGTAMNTRLEFELRNGARLKVEPQGRLMVVTVETAPAAAPVAETPAPTTTHQGVLKDVSFSTEDGRFELVLKGHDLAEYKKFRLSDPARLVFDLKDTICTFTRNTFHVNDEVVQRVRVSQFNTEGAGTVRIVLDLNKDVRDLAVQPCDDGLRLSLGHNVMAHKADRSEPEETGMEIPVKVIATPTVAEKATPAQTNPQPTADKESEPVLTDANIVQIPDPVVKPKTPEPPAPTENKPAPVRLMSARVNPDASPVNLVQDDEREAVKYTGEPITLDIKDADIVDFFRLISDIEGLNIVVDPSVQGTISMKVENVPWDQVFDLALKNNRLAKVIDGNVVRIGTMDAFKAEEQARQELKRARDTTTDIIKINYARASELVDKLTPLLTESGDIKIDERTNSMVVRDIPERIADVRKLAKALDTAEHQVEIEARIVSASRNFARSLGVQVGFVAGNLERVTVGGPNTFSTIGGYRPSQTPRSAYIAGNAQSGRGASQATTTEGAAVSVGTEGNNQRGNYNWSFPAQGATSGIGLSIGNILDTFLLDASLTAAESKGLVRIISQPKVTVQNNRSSTIEQGLQFPVQVVENNTVTVRFFSASLKLEVQPQITEEGTVLLKITIENNRADFVNTVNGIPSIVTSMSNTEVLVADGGTTVIGGILIDSDSENVDKVPLLGDVPVLGNLFKRTTKSKDSKEVLFFLTPRIIR